MNARNAMLAGLLLAPLLAAASRELTGAAWMAQVPAMPADAQAAYAQWQETPDGALKRGPALQAFQDDITGYGKDAGTAAAAAANPLGRGVEMDDAAILIERLCHRDLEMVNGQTITVDGGLSL